MIRSQVFPILATGLGSGYSKVAPGTCGTIVVAIIYALTLPYYPASPLIAFGIGIAFSLAAVWIVNAYLSGAVTSTGPACDKLDPQEIVIDEWAGFLIAIAGHAPTLATASLGFFLFRVFDVWKPFPARQLERCNRGWGIVADDVVAGFYANLALLCVANIFSL